MNAIFFDVDGTLVDSRADLAAAVNATRKELGYSELPLEEVVACVGNGARYLLEHAIPETAGRFDELWPMHMRNYAAHLHDATTLYPGVRSTLAELHDRGWLMGVVTNKPGEFTRQILDHFGIGRYFGAGPLRTAAARLRGHRVSSHDWMVGDNWTDMDCGRNAGVKTAFCTFGFGRLRESRCTMKINRFDELLRYCKAED